MAAEQRLPAQGPSKAQPGSVGRAVSVTKSFMLRLSPPAWTKQSSNQATGPPRPITARQGSYLAPRSFLEIFHAFHAGTALCSLSSGASAEEARS